MSDYLVTHGHLDDRNFQADYDDWLASLPEPPKDLPPTCGQCKFFEVTRAHLDAPNEGYCTKKLQLEWCGGDKYRLLHPKREAFDPTCDRYQEAIPF